MAYQEIAKRRKYIQVPKPSLMQLNILIYVECKEWTFPSFCYYMYAFYMHIKNSFHQLWLSFKRYSMLDFMLVRDKSCWKMFGWSATVKLNLHRVFVLVHVLIGVTSLRTKWNITLKLAMLVDTFVDFMYNGVYYASSVKVEVQFWYRYNFIFLRKVWNATI